MRHSCSRLPERPWATRRDRLSVPLKAWTVKAGAPFRLQIVRYGIKREVVTMKATGAELISLLRRLSIGGRRIDCSHPQLATAMKVDTALAYSCNCFVAHFAERFAPGELAAHLAQRGLSSTTGWFGDKEAAGRIARAATRDAQQLQAIGESGVLVTAALGGSCACGGGSCPGGGGGGSGNGPRTDAEPCSGLSTA